MADAPSTAALHRPYIPASGTLREFSWRALVVGSLLGVVFGMSSLFLTLKVGLTVSASIPVAVISITLFRLLSTLGFRDATILEHNLAQTAGSAGESIAFGVGVTMPAILILGFDLEVVRVLLVAVLGGLLGILMMIPLRRALIVHQHGHLKYPEGAACAEVLKSGANEESRAAADPIYRKSAEAAGLSAKAIFGGFAIGLIYNVLNRALRLWKDTPERLFGDPLKGGSASVEISPELLGVGYVIGPKIGGVMAAGGVMSYLLLIPLIRFFGDNLSEPLAPARRLIREMGPGEIRKEYILYIGAGAVAAGGLVSMARALPTIVRTIREGVADFSAGRAGRPTSGAAARIGQLTSAAVPRTERDLSLKLVGWGILALVAAIAAVPQFHMNPLGAALIVVLGFLFVTVSSRLTGEIGSSSNPVSGMTIATLLITCLAFLALGWTGKTHYVTALTVGAIVCIACSNGGTTSQDLKTGFLLGATPKLQQLAILAGAFASALALGPTLIKLNNAGVAYVDAAEVAPGLRVPAAELAALPRARLVGPQAEADRREFRVYRDVDPATDSARKFLVDDGGRAVWMEDPGINGVVKKLPNGLALNKYQAPKAVLVSYIIKGILTQRLPWALVLFGVMIALTLELCGVGSLAFAVGVYLPISTSLPIFIGGMIRWWADGRDEPRLRASGMTEAEIVAEGDKSPGVLMASGYIAGGAIAGIIIALIQGVATHADQALVDWGHAHNPFFEGSDAAPHAWSDALSLLPYAVLCGLLMLAARGKILGSGKPAPQSLARL